MKASEWLKVPGYGQRGVDILADLEAAEKERDEARAALKDAGKDVWQAQADRDKAEAERDVLKEELAEYKEYWEAVDAIRVNTNADEDADSIKKSFAADARIRARRGEVKPSVSGVWD